MDKYIINFILSNLFTIILLIIIFGIITIYICCKHNWERIDDVAYAKKIINDILNVYGLNNNTYFYDRLMYGFKYKNKDTVKRLEKYLLKIIKNNNCYNEIPKRLKKGE